MGFKTFLGLEVAPPDVWEPMKHIGARVEWLADNRYTGDRV
jgi:catalase (peroxidase I)